MEEKVRKDKMKTLSSLSGIIILTVFGSLIFIVLKILHLRVHTNLDIMESPLPEYAAKVLIIIIAELILRSFAGSRKEKNENEYSECFAGLMSLIRFLSTVVFTAACFAGLPDVIANEKACISVYVLVLTLLLYLFASRFLQHITLYRRKSSSENKLSSVVILSLSLLAGFYVLCLITTLFVRRSGGGFCGWLKDMWDVLTKDYIFSSRFIAVPIEVVAYKNALLLLGQNTVMMGAALMPVGIYIIANLVQVLKNMCAAVKKGFASRDLKGIWHKLRNMLSLFREKIAASPKGYCLACKCKRPLYLMLPYGVNTLDVNEDDIVENAVEQLKAKLRKRSAMDLDKYNVKVTILKPGAKIVSKSGARVSPKYCCAICYSTVYRRLVGPFVDTHKIINILLIGDRNTAKTCFCASTAKAHPNMMLKNTPEYVYFRALTERLEEDPPRAPGATPSDMIASPVLTIKNEKNTVCIVDFAGENFAQAADTVTRDDVIGLFIRADAPESIASAYDVLAQLPFKMPLIILCLSRSDELDYYPKIYEAMSICEDDLRDPEIIFKAKKIKKDEVVRARSEKLYEILSNHCPEFVGLFNLTKEHAERVEIAAHCALGTSVNKDLYLEGKYAPKFIDETLDALCSERIGR